MSTLTLIISAFLILYWYYNRFVPVQITIKPNWQDLIKDHYSVEFLHEHQTILEELYDNDSINEGGSMYEVLSDGITFTVLYNRHYTLIYNDDKKYFISALHINERFLHVTSGSEGFDICVTDPKKSYDHTYNLKIIATIPYGLFRMPTSTFWRTKRMWLKKFGWTMDEVDDPFPVSFIKHKYFEVYYRDI